MTQPPHDEPTAANTEELREQVEQTRHELGDTVQSLADKADVKRRAQEKAAALKEQTTAKTAELTDQAKAKAAEASHMLQDKVPDTVKEKAAVAAGQVRTAASQAEQVWQDKAPEPVRNNRTPLIAAGVALLAVYVLLRRKKK
ncbi:DUF3618 domain-containing protein [Streptomyces sp. MBT53]|uniref:DUF3618 domain-containing protein n=1 Tax=Streptomyces sp. MBT53 TaxID=1488384 RepID=UPI0019143D5B|nr:DUF3618 domain-containing protein [Streptomyces sp. MBT53]MBK6014055.1 DUF3618 domain-containing protein [Streptomyces sp. MBT53]